LTLLFDVPTELARQRVVGMGRELDRFEQEQEAFFSRVRQAYLARAAGSGGRIRVINAARPLHDVAKSLEEIIATY
jgi:dTMP kinase